MRSWMLGLALVVAATPAIADDKAKAKALYDEGLRHYQVAEYPQAIDAWKQSYLLSKKPLLLFNIGQAYRLSGDCKQAMTFYDNYQDAEPKPKNQDELDQAVAVCKTQLDKPAPTPAVSTTQPAEQAPVEPKPVEPVATEPPHTAPPPELVAHHGHRKLGLVLAAAGVALEGGAIYFALDGKSKGDDVADATAWNQHTKDLQSAGQRDNKLAIGLGVVGAAALVTGVVFIVTGRHTPENFAVVPTRDGAQIGWSQTF
jgi:tetratricopeptide (TPR) repeat protein